MVRSGLVFTRLGPGSASVRTRSILGARPQTGQYAYGQNTCPCAKNSLLPCFAGAYRQGKIMQTCVTKMECRSDALAEQNIFSYSLLRTSSRGDARVHEADYFYNFFLGYPGYTIPRICWSSTTWRRNFNNLPRNFHNSEL